MNPFHIIRSRFIAIGRRTKPTWWYLPRSIANQPQSIPPTSTNKKMLTLEGFLHGVMDQDNKSEITNRCTRSRSMSSCRRNSWNLKIINFRCDGISRDPLWISRRASQRHPLKTLLTWNGSCIVGWIDIENPKSPVDAPDQDLWDTVQGISWNLKIINFQHVFIFWNHFSSATNCDQSQNITNVVVPPVIHYESAAEYTTNKNTKRTKCSQ